MSLLRLCLVVTAGVFGSMLLALGASWGVITLAGAASVPAQMAIAIPISAILGLATLYLVCRWADQ